MKVIAESVSFANRGSALVHTGQGNDQLAMPHVVCMAEVGEEFPQDTGNFWTQSTIEVHSSADPKTTTTLTAHRRRAAYVFDAFLNGTLAADLSSTGTDYHCFGIRNRRLGQEREEDRSWVSSISFDAYCCGSDMSA